MVGAGIEAFLFFALYIPVNVIITVMAEYIFSSPLCFFFFFFFLSPVFHQTPFRSIFVGVLLEKQVDLLLFYQSLKFAKK